MTARFPGPERVEGYIAWLTGGHVRQVLDAGALSGEVVRLDRPPEQPAVQTRYVFATREAFERYEREAAPRLRAEGLALFGPETGVTFSREVGTVVG
ncbi:MAG: DUF4286 family protein [Leptolyngbya sp. PLA1]|nr:DUF4286 family protein [Leptolyngbya sp. PLA1]